MDPPFPFEPITDREYSLPGGARVAVWVIPNVEHFRLGEPVRSSSFEHVPDVHGYSMRDYGLRVGIWRLMDVLDDHGIRGTVALNAEVCDHEPAIVEAGVERDWEFMGHGLSNSRQLAGLAREDEREVIRATRDRIEAATGETPRGWLGPGLAETSNTLDLLVDEGFEYVCDWVNDDQPYLMSPASGELVSIPYSLAVNDFGAFLRQGLTGEQFGHVIRDQFDVLYSEGAEPGNAKVMAIALHPFLVGVPHRMPYLAEALEYITDHDDVWLATGGEIAADYTDRYLGTR